MIVKLIKKGFWWIGYLIMVVILISVVIEKGF